jgi:GNAT superfamily N-acetyltransferase
LIEPLSASERDTLLAAMARIKTLLDAKSTPAQLVLRPHRVGELGWLIHRQAVLYNQQFGWNIEFEALIAGLYGAYEATPDIPPRGLWIAEREGSVLGSVFVVPTEGLAGSAQLRMLYVEPEARGGGIGRMLVEQAVEFAKSSGYERMRLWTQSVLVSARRIYGGAGFTCIETKPHHSFGKDLVGEIWERVF